jgi:hypothetical protein
MTRLLAQILLMLLSLGIAFAVSPLVIDISRADFDDDRWFVGQTIRQMLNEKWTLLAEVFAFLPNTRSGGDATWYFSGGPQWSVRENVSFCALVGSAAGHKSPDLTGTLEATLTF